jgi:ATP-dependent Clp protease protease subunit
MNRKSSGTGDHVSDVSQPRTLAPAGPSSGQVTNQEATVRSELVVPRLVAAEMAEARVAEAPVMPFGEQVFQRLLRHRIIFLGQQVDEELANRICAELILLSSEDSRRDISIYINSPGGSVYAGLAIYDVMQYVPNDIVTYAMGMAASMGQFLLCAGTHGKRYVLQHASVLMHQPSGGIGGTASDITIQAEQILYIKRILAERTAMHTGQTVEQINRDADRDRWFTAEEAKDYGFVDHVIRSANEVLSEGPVS